VAKWDLNKLEQPQTEAIDAHSLVRAALEAENARLRTILAARDAYDRGEPSRPPQTGKARTALQGTRPMTDTTNTGSCGAMIFGLPWVAAIAQAVLQ